MMKLMLPAVLFIGLASAGAQEPPSEPSEPAVEDLSQLLLQQKEIIEGQAKELEELRKRLSEVEALALSNHNQLERSHSDRSSPPSRERSSKGSRRSSRARRESPRPPPTWCRGASSRARSTSQAPTPR
jgi:uncharacterized coiled-coil protein SlyX